MPKIRYKKIKFKEEALVIIDLANDILDDYAQRGIRMTLRSLYYRFVAGDLFPRSFFYRKLGNGKWVSDPNNGTNNNEPAYKRLGTIMNDARLAGLVDWDYLQDLTRELKYNTHRSTPAEIIRDCVSAYNRDLWEGQENYVEVWVEKDAQLGVIEGICRQLDVPFFSCRGYTSQSEMWGAGQRILEFVRAGRQARIIHLGDHDPSGKDMTRDIEERLRDFIQHHLWRDYMDDHPIRPNEDKRAYSQKMADSNAIGTSFVVNRVALTWEQIEQYDPPPNPAKTTDARAKRYIEEFGDESWEMDALDPQVMIDLISETVNEYLDPVQFAKMRRAEKKDRELLKQASERWPEIEKFLKEKKA